MGLNRRYTAVFGTLRYLCYADVALCLCKGKSQGFPGLEVIDILRTEKQIITSKYGQGYSGFECRTLSMRGCSDYEELGI